MRGTRGAVTVIPREVNLPVKLLVVVLNYRVTDLTIDCLRSLEPEIPRVPGARVAVCENGTGPDAAARLRNEIDARGWRSWVDLTVTYPNRGFCGGNNLVIRAALASADRPEYVLLLNADTVVQPGALGALVDFMDRNPAAGIAGSTLLSPAGEIQASAFRFPGVLNQLDVSLKLGPVSRLLARWALVPPTPGAACAVDWLPGASMILRTTMLDRIGLLDEGLYTYFDDVDVCRRARAAGWTTWYVPESRIVHLEGASTQVGTRIAKRRPAYWFEARRRYYLKHHRSAYVALVDGATILGIVLWRLRRFLRLMRHTTDPEPPSFLSDLVRHSVFATGFRLREVENPALAEARRDQSRAA
jgi:GT2 family glycosyltransferase